MKSDNKTNMAGCLQGKTRRHAVFINRLVVDKIRFCQADGKKNPFLVYRRASICDEVHLQEKKQ